MMVREVIGSIPSPPCVSHHRGAGPAPSADQELLMHPICGEKLRFRGRPYWSSLPVCRKTEEKGNFLFGQPPLPRTESADLPYCVYSCRKSFIIRPSLCKPLFRLCFCCPVFSFVLLISTVCVCVLFVSGRICAAVFFVFCFFFLQDLSRLLPVCPLCLPPASPLPPREPFWLSPCDSWMSLRTPRSEPGNAGFVSVFMRQRACVRSHLAGGDSKQGWVSAGGGLRECKWEACCDIVGSGWAILESSRGSANLGGGPRPRECPTQKGGRDRLIGCRSKSDKGGRRVGSVGRVGISRPRRCAKGSF